MALMLHQQPLQLGQHLLQPTWHLIVDGALQHLQIVEFTKQLLPLLEAVDAGGSLNALQRGEIFQAIASLLDLPPQLVQHLHLALSATDLPARMEKHAGQAWPLPFDQPLPDRLIPQQRVLGLLQPELQLGQSLQVGAALQHLHHMAVGQLPLPAQLLEHGPEGLHLGLRQLGQEALL